MKLKLFTNQIKFDIKIWNLNQTQIKSWRFDLRLDSNSNLLTCQEFKFDSNSNSSRNFRLASRVKSTHSSLKLDLTINLFSLLFLFFRLNFFFLVSILVFKLWDCRFIESDDFNDSVCSTTIESNISRV